jgi:hypothetical protein
MANRIAAFLASIPSAGPSKPRQPPDSVLAMAEMLAGDSKRQPLTKVGRGVRTAWGQVAAKVYRYEVVRGDGQIHRRNSQVPLHPSVKVTDAFGRPKHLTVHFTAGSGGSVQNQQATTDQYGVVSCGTWKLGPGPGLNEVIARDGNNKEIAVFRAMAI